MRNKISKTPNLIKEESMQDTVKFYISKALYEYVMSEGCTCCENSVKHIASFKELATLLDLPLRESDKTPNYTEDIVDFSKWREQVNVS